jgi:hypothetical protein
MWTDDLIETEIKNVMKALNINRMPSSVEIERIAQNNKLTNAIARHGGFNFWSEKLNLKQSKCETRLGQFGEYYIKELLESKGYIVEKMGIKHPYDLLVNENVKIDVKTSKIYKPTNESWSSYSFNLEKEKPTCDIYVFTCLANEKEVNKILVIPSKFLHQTQLCISTGKTKYDMYKNRWDYIEQYDKFYKTVI